MLVFRFYKPGADSHFFEQRYKGISIIPPMPQKGDKVVLKRKVYLVTDTPTHYFETVHEVGFVVQELLNFFEEDALKREVSSESGSLKNLTLGQLTAKSATQATEKPRKTVCGYCADETCPGGEECNFYDGSLE